LVPMLVVLLCWAATWQCDLLASYVILSMGTGSVGRWVCLSSSMLGPDKIKATCIVDFRSERFNTKLLMDN
jgi:hypothetical protein